MSKIQFEILLKKVEYRDYKSHLETVYRSNAISGEFPSEQKLRDAVAAHLRKVRREHGKRFGLNLKILSVSRRVNLNPHGHI